ncbi:adenylate kinase 4, mitochondrial [Lates japonicus]|uniref:Adenylate kinase 4, mitochondrial n=1 Tax=Lates japonicus TaxID=270547 RepID=A0AAD3QYS9_LATJO|nr:adenylate kinase 4, mitochondrial [Lates japonicus]
MAKLFRAAIMGPPGSGKGTISKRIAQSFGLQYLSSGHYLREGIAANTEAGVLVKTYVERGMLVPDHVMTRLMLPRLEQLSGQSWLLDGFPRTLAQAVALNNLYQLDLVISLNIPYETLRERLSDRWIHPASGRVYNMGFNPPRVQPLTGGECKSRSVSVNGAGVPAVSPPRHRRRSRENGESAPQVLSKNPVFIIKRLAMLRTALLVSMTNSARYITPPASHVTYRLVEAYKKKTSYDGYSLCSWSWRRQLRYRRRAAAATAAATHSGSIAACRTRAQARERGGLQHLDSSGKTHSPPPATWMAIVR